jgi:uroporphyrinogen-III decarboxylase
MTSKERVVAAIHHRPPDQVPIDFGSTAVTGIHVSCVAALRDYYGLERRPVKVHEPFQMLGLIEEDLKQAMGLDVDGVFRRNTMFGFPLENWKPWRTYQGLEVLVPGAFNTTTDSNGGTLLYPEGDLSCPPSGHMPANGYFFDAIIRQNPIVEEHLNPEDNVEEFQPITAAEVAEVKADAEAVAAGRRGVMASFGGTSFGDIALVPAPSLKHPQGIRDVAEWYMSTSSRREYVHRIFARQCEIGLANLARIHAAIGNLIDAVFICGTDFGTQSGTFCSVKTFRDLWVPYYRQVNDWIHAATSWKSLKHSCGSVDRFIPFLIDAGFDILNPVQCSAANMEAGHLKADYGDRIVFWGGGIDTQKVLPFGTPGEVRKQVIERCRVFSQGGGFVFNSIHNVQAQTPIANIVAMIDAVHEFNGVTVHA